MSNYTPAAHRVTIDKLLLGNTKWFKQSCGTEVVSVIFIYLFFLSHAFHPPPTSTVRHTQAQNYNVLCKLSFSFYSENFLFSWFQGEPCERVMKDYICNPKHKWPKAQQISLPWQNRSKWLVCVNKGLIVLTDSATEDVLRPIHIA